MDVEVNSGADNNIEAIVYEILDALDTAPVDFKSYDTNNDSIISTNELQIVTVFPGWEASSGKTTEGVWGSSIRIVANGVIPGTETKKVATAGMDVLRVTILVGKSKETAQKVQSFASPVTVTIPYENKTNPNTLSMFRVLPDGTLENVGGVHTEGGYKVKLDAFSEFIIKDNKVEFKDVSPTDSYYISVEVNNYKYIYTSKGI